MFLQLNDNQESVLYGASVWSHLGKLALYPLSQQSQAVSRTHGPDGCQQNKGQEVHDMRQTGLFCLGVESREDMDVKEEVTGAKEGM